MRRGEVRPYTFDAPNKRRPVVILTRDAIIPYLNEVTVAEITSTIRGIGSEVLLGPEDGMARQCVINCDHLQTVLKRQLGGVITTLSDEKLAEVGPAVDFALDLRLQE